MIYNRCIYAFFHKNLANIFRCKIGIYVIWIDKFWINNHPDYMFRNHGTIQFFANNN